MNREDEVKAMQKREFRIDSDSETMLRIIYNRA